MDVRAEDGYHVDRARVQERNCTGVQEQHWLLIYVENTDGIEDLYQIRSQRSGKCLDAADSRGTNAFTGRPDEGPLGANVRQFSCAPTRSQSWVFTVNGEIRNQANGLCLDTTGIRNDPMVTMLPCAGRATQRWSW